MPLIAGPAYTSQLYVDESPCRQTIAPTPINAAANAYSNKS